MKDTQDRPQNESSYDEQNNDTHPSGEKGGLSRKPRTETSTIDTNDAPGMSDDDMEHENTSW